MRHPTKYSQWPEQQLAWRLPMFQTVGRCAAVATADDWSRTYPNSVESWFGGADGWLGDRGSPSTGFADSGGLAHVAVEANCFRFRRIRRENCFGGPGVVGDAAACAPWFTWSGRGLDHLPRAATVLLVDAVGRLLAGWTSADVLTGPEAKVPGVRSTLPAVSGMFASVETIVSVSLRRRGRFRRNDLWLRWHGLNEPD